MKKFLIKYFGKLPIFGGLVNCSAEDCGAAVKELLSTLVIAMSPIWMGAFFLLIRTNETRDYFSILKESLQNGELMIYCTALLAPIFFITSSDKYLYGVFPNKLSSIISAIVILMITTAVYTLQKSGSIYNHALIFTLSITLFIISLLILFVNKVYNNSKISRYIDIFQQQEKDFSSQLNKRRP